MIDFDKIAGKSSDETLIHPREIFHVLPEKVAKYTYPRDVQTEVWNQWHDRRNSRDIVLKMNTGAGKTVVGLLILKSCLNENAGPAVYVAPDPYLVQQVIGEGEALGLEMTDDPRSPRYQRGKAILVINIHKLINGLSVFGVGDEGIKIPIGSIIIDDAHACLATTEEKFTLTVDKNSPSYQAIYPLFRTELIKQSETKILEIDSQISGTYMQIPFWSWNVNLQELGKKLFEFKEKEKPILFSWPLIKNNLNLCRGVIGEGIIEISPRCLPISEIPSITNARRRIFMTATLAEDSVLFTHFDADIESIQNPVTPANADDIGERMILIPQELNPATTDEEVKALLKKLSLKYNTVVIVPSTYRSTFWNDVADRIVFADGLEDAVKELKVGHVGLVVVVNKYDGIDLPYDSCRVLAIDGLPDVRRRIDKIEQGALMGSSELQGQLVQKIEQGMGRGVRSNDDYCVVFLMGRTLIDQLYRQGTMAKFTPATQAQFELSEQIADQIRGKDIDELEGAAKYCLERNKGWIKASKGVLAGLKSPVVNSINEIARHQKMAFDFASLGNFEKATETLQIIINKEENKRVKGWLMQQLAELVYFLNPVEAQEILKTAVQFNRQIIRPIKGISYNKLSTSTDSQANLCASFWKDNFSSPNEFIIKLNGILEDLIFLPNCAPSFEEAFKNVARMIGYASQRPEAEYGKGPDVLWEIGQLQYLVIECKNGVTTEYVKKHDCDQLAGSMHWFTHNYDYTCKATPLLVHPTRFFDKYGSPHPATRVMTKENLDFFKKSLEQFGKTVSGVKVYCNPKEIDKFLNHFKLTPNELLKTYSVKYQVLSS